MQPVKRVMRNRHDREVLEHYYERRIAEIREGAPLNPEKTITGDELKRLDRERERRRP